MRVSVPPNTFAVPLQLTLTTANLRHVEAVLDSGRFASYDALSGVGVAARMEDGTEVRGRLGPRTISLTLTGTTLDSGAALLRWDNTQQRYSRVESVRMTERSATVRFNRAGAFVLVTPK